MSDCCNRLCCVQLPLCPKAGRYTGNAVCRWHQFILRWPGGHDTFNQALGLTIAFSCGCHPYFDELGCNNNLKAYAIIKNFFYDFTIPSDSNSMQGYFVLCIYVLGNIYYVPCTGCLLAVYHGCAAWLASMHLEYVHHALISPLAYIYIYIYIYIDGTFKSKCTNFTRHAYT